MRFICDNCKAKYSIADEKINKKVLKIRCKKCSHVIIVRDTQAAKQSAPSTQQTRPQANGSQQRPQPAPSSPFTPMNQRPAPANSAPVGPGHPTSLHEEESDVGERTVVARISAEWFNNIRAEKHEEPIWFMALHGAPFGPVVLSEVINRIQTKELGPEDLVWCAGWADWIPANTVNELRGAFAPTPKVAPPPPVKLPPAPKPVQQRPAPAPQRPAPAPQRPAPAPAPAQAKPAGANGAPRPQQPAISEPAKPAPASPFDRPLSKGTSPFDPQSPFGSPVSSPSKPQDASSPLAMLAESQAPQEKPKPPTPSAPQGLQTASATSAPTSQTPESVLAAAPAPQPILSELTPAPAPIPQAPQEDIAHLQEARPASFADGNVEESFFQEHGIQHSQDDLLEVALPPLPNWEQHEEIDADDIIEITDALKPSMGKRIAIIASLLAVLGIVSFLLTGDNGIKINLNDPIDEPDQVTPRNQPQTRYNGTVGNGALVLGKQPKKKVRQRSNFRISGIPSRNTRRPSARRSTNNAKTKSGPIDINDQIRQAYLKKLGIKTKKGGIGGSTSGRDISYSLKKRIYREIERNRAQVKYCYEQYLKKTYIYGRFLVKIRITSTGTVSHVAVLSRKFKKLRITKCIKTKMRRWRFASFSETPYIDLKIPYILQASGF